MKNQDVLTKTFNKIIKELKNNNVKIKFVQSDSISIDRKAKVKSSGYFATTIINDDEPEFVIAIKRPYLDWFGTFIHEYCHFKQWKENSKLWRNYNFDDVISVDLLVDFWLKKKMEFNRRQLNSIIDPIINVEADCEKRVVKLIEKYKLPINKEDYIQKANAYIAFYEHLKATRKWYSSKRAPYNIKSVYSKYPKDKVFKDCKEVKRYIKRLNNEKS